MKRNELEHLIRAAGNIADDDLVVIGSQAILATHPDAPASLLFSMEADVYPRSEPSQAGAIDAVIGDGSPFHESYGYYAHSVGPETAKAPAGWESRLIPVRAPTALGGDPIRTGWCLEVHDLVLAKLARGNQRDWDFAEICIANALVAVETLRSRARTVPAEYVEMVTAGLEGVIARAEQP